MRHMDALPPRPYQATINSKRAVPRSPPDWLDIKRLAELKAENASEEENLFSDEVLTK